MCKFVIHKGLCWLTRDTENVGAISLVSGDGRASLEAEPVLLHWWCDSDRLSHLWLWRVCKV